MSKINFKEALAIERDIEFLVNRQTEYGVKFDLELANTFIQNLEIQLAEKEFEVTPYLTTYVTVFGPPVKEIRLKNGSFNASVRKWYPEEELETISGPFTRIVYNTPKISQRGVITSQLIKHGWKPKIFTETGQPKITVDGLPVPTLEKVGKFGKSLSEWYVTSHRKSLIESFLPNVRSDGRIEAQINACATNTARGAHRVVANLPRVTSFYGKEVRSLFTVDEGRVLVGSDAAGLELRMLAHYMNDKEYTEVLLSGDIHTFNKEAAGLSIRDQAKTFIYGFL